MATVAPTKARAEVVDFTHPSIYIPVTFAIPPPHISYNILAVFEPFQYSASISSLNLKKNVSIKLATKIFFIF